jgi:hypothetical protein
LIFQRAERVETSRCVMDNPAEGNPARLTATVQVAQIGTGNANGVRI